MKMVWKRKRSLMRVKKILMNMKKILPLYFYVSYKILQLNFFFVHNIYKFFHLKVDVIKIFGHLCPLLIIPHIGHITILISKPTVTIFINKAI